MTLSPASEAPISTRLNWHPKALLAFLQDSLNLVRDRQGYASEKSPWWSFLHAALRELPKKIQAFIAGSYRFSPMLKYDTPEEQVLVWQYMDRLFVRALLFIIKPLFPHIFSHHVFHLQGPSGVQKAIAYVQRGLEQYHFRYFFRIDIKSYYASIDHQILLEQLAKVFDDTRMKNYLESIITIPHLKDGVIKLPTQGIPRRSSLSPFFGALYLSPLDEHFSKIPEVLYVRFMDDILILTQTKRQYTKAKKKLKQILSSLKLNYSRKKTKMGHLSTGFHFLGVEFNCLSDESEAETQIQPCNKVQVKLHNRSCARALSMVQLMNENAVHPAHLQSYLGKWSTWWSRTALIFRNQCLNRWVEWVEKKDPPLAWLGSGLYRL